MTDPRQKVLVIQLGQLGDTVLSLPALKTIRHLLPDAQITCLAAVSPSRVLRMSGLFDEVISVDRNAIRDAGILTSIRDIFRIFRKVRRGKFDLVIDLQSLYESNLLGYFSGAPKRLFRKRENRSIDFLSNFDPPPPEEDRSKHMAIAYLETLNPFGIDAGELLAEHTSSTLLPLESISTEREVREGTRPTAIGLNLGAGHPSRCWPIERFVQLGTRLSEDFDVSVFWGPEEGEITEAVIRDLPDSVRLCPDLDVEQLAVEFSGLDVVIGNDTGPIHLAAAVGCPVILIKARTETYPYKPIGSTVICVEGDTLESISSDEVAEAVVSFTQGGSESVDSTP